MELIRYLHLNPVRIGIVELPHEYPWSSHSIYLTGKPLNWLEVTMPLSCLAQNRNVAISIQGFINDKQKEGHREDLYQIKEQRYLGKNDFIEKVEERLNKEQTLSVELPMDDIVNEISKVYKFPIRRLIDSSRNRKGALLRAIAVYISKRSGRNCSNRGSPFL